jgi:hypothetical protein
MNIRGPGVLILQLSASSKRGYRGCSIVTRLAFSWPSSSRACCSSFAFAVLYVSPRTYHATQRTRRTGQLLLERGALRLHAPQLTLDVLCVRVFTLQLREHVCAYALGACPS